MFDIHGVASPPSKSMPRSGICEVPAGEEWMIPSTVELPSDLPSATGLKPDRLTLVVLGPSSTPGGTHRLEPTAGPA